MLIETENPDSNWLEVQRLWTEICDFRTPNEEVTRKTKNLLIALWNEKDWLKSEFPDRKMEIEDFVNKSKHLTMVADLANTLKHRKLRRRKSEASEVEYTWNSKLTGFRNRDIGMIQVTEREFVSVSGLILNSIAEFEKLRVTLYV